MRQVLPAALAARPFDKHRKLPIPFANVMMHDGQPDFTALDGERVAECGQKRLCGLCGTKIGYWLAFIGGPECARSRAFLDPPMHVDCAEWAMRLCPHIAIAHSQRRKNPISGKSEPFAGWVEEKPETFILYVTREYKLLFQPTEPSVVVAVFRPAPASSVFTREEVLDGS